MSISGVLRALRSCTLTSPACPPEANMVWWPGLLFQAKLVRLEMGNMVRSSVSISSATLTLLTSSAVLTGLLVRCRPLS